MRRTTRRLTAWLLMLGLFLAQLTTLAHACPRVEAAFGPDAATHMAGPCAGMSDDDRTIVSAPCAEHCQYGSHATNTASADQAVQAPLHFLVVAMPAQHAPLAPYVHALRACETTPPVFASSSRLRI